MNLYDFKAMPCAFGQPVAHGEIKSIADDFVVIEHLPFELEQTGEHVYLQIQKTHLNTQEVVKILARLAGVRVRDVGYAGLKDRNAQTIQWFSVWLPGRSEPDWRSLESDRLKLLTVQRHSKKLKIGVLRYNEFRLVIRQLTGQAHLIESRLQQIRQMGFPNYFGEQRFGRDGQNIAQALAYLQGQPVRRELKSLLLSVARSGLFNQILAIRVAQGNWNQAIEGDLLLLDGTQSFFKINTVDQTLVERVKVMDVHPSGLLYGRNNTSALCDVGEASCLEQQVLIDYAEWKTGLDRFDLQAGRRSLRARVMDLNWQWRSESELELSFLLPPGTYATTLLKEWLVWP
jgi:tRNA pseudouridine13 synthase